VEGKDHSELVVAFGVANLRAQGKAYVVVFGLLTCVPPNNAGSKEGGAAPTTS